MKAYIKTLGCRTNQFDSAVIQERLAEKGVGLASAPEEADVLIVNTCAVTARAEQKNAQAIRRLSRDNPRAALFVTGCGPAYNRGNYEALGGIKGVFGINAAPALLSGLGLTPDAPADPFGRAQALGNRTRGHIKVQEGCDAFCAYCVVPLVRGAPVSRPFNDVLEHARRLCGLGVPEIVLTGIHVGRYQDGAKGLADLVTALASLPALGRVRLSSIEPNEVSEELIRLATSHPKVCNHLHISLQSGDDRVLEAMGRGYRARDFFSLLERIRSRDPLCGLGTDVIAGFPGEEPSQAETTLSRIRESALTHGHVFPFSARRGTRAHGMDGQVDKEEKNRRCAELKAAFGALKAKFMGTMAGRELCVVFEGSGKGLSSNYLRVRSLVKKAKGALERVHISRMEGDELITG